MGLGNIIRNLWQEPTLADFETPAPEYAPIVGDTVLHIERKQLHGANTMNAAQISEIAALVKLQSEGKVYIPARTLSRFAKTYALKHGIIVKERGRYYAGNTDIVYSLEASILWELVKPMVQNGIGFSVTKNAEWLRLNIYPRGHRFHQARDLQAMESIFARLHWEGFVNFNAAGSVWAIYVNN